jgi:hypothetical protein
MTHTYTLMNLSQNAVSPSQQSRASHRGAAFMTSKFAVENAPLSPDLSAPYEPPQPASRVPEIAESIESLARDEYPLRFSQGGFYSQPPSLLEMPEGFVAHLQRQQQELQQELNDPNWKFQPVPQLFPSAAASAAAPAAAPVSVAPIPIIGPAMPMHRMASQAQAQARCAAYRALLASPDCLYFTNVDDGQCVAQMMSAFACIDYDFDHSVSARKRIDLRSLATEPKWIDHAFWIARHFFTADRFPVAEDRWQLVRSFFIISMRLYLIESGVSCRLRATPHFDHGILATPQRDADSKPSFEKLGFLPISMPASTRFSIGAQTVNWPAGVRIGDLWEHDICALFVLVPELVTAFVMLPHQHATAAPFRRMLFANCYWPAIKVADNVAVLVDECVRKMCTLQALYFDQATYSVESYATPYWPVIVPKDEHKKRLAQIRKQRELSKKRRRPGDDDDDDTSAAAGRVPAQEFAFNRCRRADGSEFWLTPYVRWNDNQGKTAIPKILAEDFSRQSLQQRTAIHFASNAQDLARLYPSLYADPANRAKTLARYSNTVQVDAMGEYMMFKSGIVKEHMRNINSC